MVRQADRKTMETTYLAFHLHGPYLPKSSCYAKGYFFPSEKVPMRFHRQDILGFEVKHLTTLEAFFVDTSKDVVVYDVQFVLESQSTWCGNLLAILNSRP